MGFSPISLCVLTVWASIRDPVSIGEWRPAFIRDPAFNRSSTVIGFTMVVLAFTVLLIYCAAMMFAMEENISVFLFGISLM